MKRRNLCILGLVVCCTFIGACGNKTADEKIENDTQVSATESDVEHSEEKQSVYELEKIVINGYEWGPSVDKVVIKPATMPENLSKENYEIKTAGAPREIENVYRSNEKGESDDTGAYLTIQMTVQNHVGSPFVIDMSNGAAGHNEWADEFVVSLTVSDGDGSTVYEKDMINDRYSPETEIFVKDSVTGYKTGGTDGEEITIQRAAYEPETLKEDGVKNPLIIWLHGAGEGGTDVDIALLGNEVTALVRDEIQSQFTTAGGENGVYVLALQAPTYWMDNGDGSVSVGNDSIYRDVLTSAIEEYVENNQDVDTSRIYIGGCSNGGYMTMNLMVHDDKNFFAAAYPVCEAYADEMLSDEDIERLSERNIWFVQSANDTTVDPTKFGMPTYQRLLKAGAKNCWYSMFEKVIGQDMEGNSYNGHWSWISLFNNNVTKAQNPADVLAGDSEDYGFVPENPDGGTVSPQDCATIFEWMNQQTNE